MFQPLPLFVGLRYVRARNRKFFVSFITWVSLAGVCVGVAALIVILSVMNGFEGISRERLLALSAHARVIAGPGDEGSAAAAQASTWQSALAAMARLPGVTGVAPYAELQVLALRGAESRPLQLRGVDPALEPQVSEIARALREGALTDLQPGAARLLLGHGVAAWLGVGVGDPITLLVPGVDAGGTPVPRLREFRVAGIFEVGHPETDSLLALGHIEEVFALAGAEPRAFGLVLRYADALQAPAGAAAAAAKLPAGLTLRDWTQDHANFFRAVRIEKTMMTLILLLIVGVAAFNIVAMLVMVVTDKRTDIAILRTLGASPRRVMGVFLVQGLVIGWSGVLLGVLLGVVLAINATEVVALLERLFGFRIMNPEVFVISRIPSELRWTNVGLVAGAALILTTLATLYPAWRASRVAPAEALRYE
jgi:lipoprotein-releasing system permease protein